MTGKWMSRHGTMQGPLGCLQGVLGRRVPPCRSVGRLQPISLRRAKVRTVAACASSPDGLDTFPFILNFLAEQLGAQRVPVTNLVSL